MEVGTASDPNSTHRINTYHCVCTTLLLATTHTLASLPCRADPAVDKAIILPLPPTPNDEENADADNKAGYSLLLSTTLDRKPLIVRREDGFEKRILLRCGRCRLVVGYKLDEAQFGAEKKGGEVVYLLPGGLVTSEDMAAGKVPEEVQWAGVNEA